MSNRGDSPGDPSDWPDEADLDEIFSTWVPGPPDSAPAAEREMAGTNPPVDPEPGLPSVDPDPVANRVEPETIRSPVPRVYDLEPLPAPPEEPPKVSRPWTRSDDDVLPGRRPRGRRGP